jgi:hypothetical protein
MTDFLHSEESFLNDLNKININIEAFVNNVEGNDIELRHMMSTNNTCINTSMPCWPNINKWLIQMINDDNFNAYCKQKYEIMGDFKDRFNKKNDLYKSFVDMLFDTGKPIDV